MSDRAKLSDDSQGATPPSMPNQRRSSEVTDVVDDNAPLGGLN